MASMLPVFESLPSEMLVTGMMIVLATAAMFWTVGQVSQIAQRRRQGTLGSGRDPRLSGSVGYYDVAVGQSFCCLTEREVDIMVTAEHAGWGPFRRRQLWLEILRAPSGFEATKPTGATDAVSTGDATFDRRVQVRGDVVRAVSLLNYSARESLKDVVALGGEVRDRTIRCRLPMPARAATIRKRGRRMVDLSIALEDARSAGTAVALSRLVREDPNQGVRSTALSMLKVSGTSNALVSRELRQLSHALDGQERMDVAIVAQDVDFFLTIAEDREERGDLRSEALATAASLSGRVNGLLLRLCREFIDSPSSQLRTAALYALVQPGGDRYVEVAREWIREAVLVGGPRSAWLRNDGGVSLGAAFSVLTAHGDWADVPLLLTALPELGHVAFRQALVTLTTHGTIEDVAALHEIAGDSEPGRGELIREAIREIQASVSTRAGAISLLSDHASGALTMAQADVGGLQLVPTDEGPSS